MSRKFNVSFSGGCELSVEEVWPDGDAPENPDVLDVAEKMSSHHDVLVTWNLVDDVEIWVGDKGISRRVAR